MWFNPKARLLSKLFAAKATNRKTKKQKWSKQQIQIYNITHLQTFLLNLLFVILTQEQKILIILQRFSNKRPISVQLIIKYLYLYLTYNNIVNKDLIMFEHKSHHNFKILHGIVAFYLRSLRCKI